MKRLLLACGLLFLLVVGDVHMRPRDIDLRGTAYGWVEGQRLVAHALGGIEGHTGTNAREALERSLARGHTLFEVDLLLTRDERLVARHDWEARRTVAFGQDVPPERLGQPFSHAEFKASPIHRRYQPLDFAELAEVMAAHPEITLITDTKHLDPTVIRRQFGQLVAEARRVDASILERVVPQIYGEAMLPVVREVYPFGSYIYTLYLTISTDDQIVDFCRREGIRVVAMPPHRASRRFLEQLSEAGIVAYVHTVNGRGRAEGWIRHGVYGLYTDFLAPGELSLPTPFRFRR